MSYTRNNVNELTDDELEQIISWGYEHLYSEANEEYNDLKDYALDSTNEDMKYLCVDELNFGNYGLDTVTFSFGDKFYDDMNHLAGNGVNYEIEMYDYDFKVNPVLEELMEEIDNALIIIYGPDGELDTTYNELIPLLTKGEVTDYSYEDMARAIGEKNVNAFVQGIQNMRNNIVNDFKANEAALDEKISNLEDFDDGGDVYTDWVKSFLEINEYKFVFDDNGRFENFDY